jgi:DNA-binding MarR family transcriptional regulator
LNKKGEELISVIDRFRTISFFSLFPEYNPMDLHILKGIEVVCGKSPDGSVRVSEIVSYMGIHPSAVSRGLGVVEKKDLVERYPDPKDRRATRVRLTEKGRETAEAFGKIVEDYFDAVFGRLGEERCDELLEDLGLLEEISHDELEKRLDRAGLDDEKKPACFPPPILSREVIPNE